MYRRSVIAAGVVSLAGCSQAMTDAVGPDRETAENALRDKINAEREAAGVHTLAVSDTLATAARDHSRDMDERDFYGHENPDGEGPSDRVPCRASENLHRGDIARIRNANSDKTWSTADGEELAGYVAEGWTISEPHRENMIAVRWQNFGVGIHVGDAEFFATALFC